MNSRVEWMMMRGLPHRPGPWLPLATETNTKHTDADTPVTTMSSSSHVDLARSCRYYISAAYSFSCPVRFSIGVWHFTR